jgi:hypothetical protein
LDQVNRSDDQSLTRANRHPLHFGCEFASFVPGRAQGCEMYQRNIAPLGLPCARNTLATEGGLQSAPLLR